MIAGGVSSSLGRLALFLLVGGLAPACASPARRSEGDPSAPAPSELEVLEWRLRSETILPEFVPLSEALAGAVRAHYDDAARVLLARVMARSPEGRALELARGFERVLTGRALIAPLRLTLETWPSEDRSSYVLLLVAHNAGSIAVTLRPGPAMLRLEQLAVDLDGRERSTVRTSSTDELPALELAPGGAVRTQLLEFAPPASLPSFHVAPQLKSAAASTAPSATGLEPAGEVLAARFVFELELGSGSIEFQGTRYPAMGIEIASAERVWLERSLPERAEDPGSFVAAALAPESTAHELLSIAVRIPGGRREEALGALALRSDELSRVALRQLAPALRWLSGDSRPGSDPEAWADALRARRAGAQVRRTDALDLPRAR